MTSSPMSKVAFAEVMGVDRSQCTRWAERGMPVLADGRIDAVKAARWVRAYVGKDKRERHSNGARAERAGGALRQDEAIDALIRTAIRLTVHAVPSLTRQLAADAKVSASKAAALYDLSLRGAPLIEAAILELMQISSDAEAEPFTAVSLPLPLLKVAVSPGADA